MTSELTSSSSTKALTYPRIIIQPDWSVNLRSNALPTDVWIEFKYGDAPISRITQNIHGVCSIKALTNPEAKVYKTSASDNFQAGDIDQKQQKLRIKIRDAEFSHTFQGPIKSFSTRGKQEDDEANAPLDPMVNVPELRKTQHQISAFPHWFDISSGGVGLSALSDGKITIWDVENGEVRRRLKGHIEDVYISRFFPSDFAVVSGGADMTVRVWALDSENNQIRDMTLKGHRSRINDVHALDQQTVLSASNDGSALLWDITKNEQKNKVAVLENNSINCISLTDPSTVACACNDGSVRLYNLNSGNGKVLNEIKIGSPISTVCYLPEVNQLVYGTEQSAIGIYDIRQLNDQPIHTWKEQRGKLTCMVPSRDKGGILVTSSDGSCFEYNQEELKIMPNGTQIHVNDYTGADDCVQNGKVFQNRIYSIARDGLVRIYETQE